MQAERTKLAANRKRPVAERFWEKVEPAADLSPNGTPGCLVWTGCLTKRGYGSIQVRPGGTRLAHSVAWLLIAGRTMPEGHELDHLCRRHSCVNVDHLEPVDHATNVRRGANTKLSPVDVREIRRLVASGVRRRELAVRYGLHVSSIDNIATGKRWRGV